MKTLEQYMALPYPLEIIPDSDEGGFVGSYPDLPGCLTCGETMEDVVPVSYTHLTLPTNSRV